MVRRGCLVILALFLVLSLVVSAQSASISINDVETSEEVKVPIEIANVTDLGAASIWLEYDPAVVEVSKVSGGDLGSVTSSVNNDEGLVK